MVNLDNCDYILSCECISAENQNISSILIFSEKQTKIEWAIRKQLEPQDFAFYQWIRLF